MSDLSATVDAMLAGRTVYAALLFFFDFDGDPVRYWTGPTTLRTLDGHTWKGGGSLISLDLLSPALGTTAQPATVTLSGVDPSSVLYAAQNIDKAIERDVITYVQFFGDGENGQQFQPLDMPYALGAWISDQPSFDGTGGTVRTISLSLESYFVGRSRSPNSYYSYTEQVNRAVAMGYTDAVDTGGEFMTALQNKYVTFPN